MSEAVISETALRGKERKRHGFLVDVLLRLLKEKPLGTLGGIIVIIMFLTGIFADVLAPYGFNEMVLGNRLQGPSSANVLGADHLGRDMLSRIIYGARISMIVGLAGSISSVIVAIFIGLISGFIGGKTDTVIQRFVDAWMCIPGLFILLTIMSILGPGIWQIIIVLGPFYGIRNSRIVRGAVIGIKENMYVDATRAIGAPTSRVLLKHILPNVMAPILIIFTVNMGQIILIEATLSFLGFGIPPPTPSWGGMLSESGRRYLLLAPWMALWPGLALSIVVYGINMLGDGVRDVLDPRLRGGLGRYSGVEKKRAKRLEQEEKSAGSA